MNFVYRSLRFLIVLLLTSSVILLAQEEENKIPRDNSYTLEKAYQKIKKKYPGIELVKPFDDLKIKRRENIKYVKYGERELSLDLFSPLNQKEKLPAVVLIHGGGWASGSKNFMIPLAQKIAAEGYVTAAMEYRLSPEALYPAAVKDIKSAVKFLKDNSELYNIDTSSVAVLGCSAGGHLAAFAGVTSGIKKFEPENYSGCSSSKVQAVVDIDGILDFTDPAESGKDTAGAKPSVGKRWLGYTYKEYPGIWEEASPVNYVSESTPPVLFINSSRDRFHAGRDEMIAEMNRFDAYSEIHTLENSPHTFWLFRPWFEPTLNYAVDFLNKTLKQNQ